MVQAPFDTSSDHVYFSHFKVLEYSTVLSVLYQNQLLISFTSILGPRSGPLI